MQEWYLSLKIVVVYIRILRGVLILQCGTQYNG